MLDFQKKIHNIFRECASQENEILTTLMRIFLQMNHLLKMR